MRSTASKVREFAMGVARDAMFTTAQLLHLGTRNAVDIELCRLVRRGIIKRLAFGVFMNVVNVADAAEVPSAFEIANIKAERFGKRIVEAEPNSSKHASKTFHTNGCKSSFHSVHGRLQFKHLAPNKFNKQAANSNKTNAIEGVPAQLDDYLELAEKKFTSVSGAGKLEHKILSMSFRLVRLIIRFVQDKEGTILCGSLP